MIVEEWVCVIPDYDLISPNVLMRMHFWQRNKEHEKLVDLILVYGQDVVEVDAPVDITVVREYGYRKRQMDPDNLYGAVKTLLDVLRKPSPRSKKVSLGIIADDSPNNISNLSVTQKKSEDKTTRLRVSISLANVESQ